MAMEMSDHETYCGIRAERCDQCPDWVQLKEWDSHQSRYHATVNRRFRERSVIAQTETIIDYNASKLNLVILYYLTFNEIFILIFYIGNVPNDVR